MERLTVKFGEALLHRQEPPSSAEPDRAFVEGAPPIVRQLFPNADKLKPRPPFRSGPPEPPPAPSAPESPSPTEVLPVPKAKVREFPPETRRKVLAAIAGGMNQGAAGKKYGVKSQSVVSRWVKVEREAKAKEPTLRSRPEPPARSLEVVAKELAEATARVEALKAEMRRLLE